MNTKNMNTKNKELALKSLNGLWVGDCIGNMGQLYNGTDILKALVGGIVKFGIDNIDPRGHSFQYSDDTDEATVLLNHLVANSGSIDQDKLAMEFATRFMYHKDGGEYMGYGLQTRKVLTDIYNGVPWREANLTFRKSEGMSSTDNVIAGLAAGKSVKESLAELKKISQAIPDANKLVGSCGNGSAMRVAPLGAYFCDKSPEEVVKLATLSAEPTHSHPEGIAGAIAIALLSKFIANVNVSTLAFNQTTDIIYGSILRYIPESEVKNGIKKARMMGRSATISELIEALGNGTHVTCQDTVPLCVFLTIRAITQHPIHIEEIYEKVIIETCKCFGDVDTNCAIVGGMVGIISSPPQKWIRYCQPMEGLPDEPLPEILTERNKNVIGNKNAIKEALNNTIAGFTVEDQAASLYETETVIMESMKLLQPAFEEILERRKKELNIK
jgi:ADP-ribosylglycohydrolase